MRPWIFNCREVTRLVSESLDRELPLYQRIGIRLHLSMCRFCSRYRKQLLFIKEAIARCDEKNCSEEIFEPLSDEVRERMKQALAHSGDSNFTE